MKLNKKETKKFQQLLDSFWEVCSICDEMDVYEFPDGDQAMQEVKDWVSENFGRKITNEERKSNMDDETFTALYKQ